MNLNGIPCGGYSVVSNPIRFSLYDTTLTDISALNKETLTFTVDDDHVYTFGGYEILTIERNKSSYTVIFNKRLDESTKQSIEALETNVANLSKVTQTSILSLATVTDPIPSLLMRAELSDMEAVNYVSVYPEWQIGFDYKQNWIFRYGEDLYRVGQDHTSQEQWVPGETGTESLYSKIEFTSGGYEIWQEYDGVSGTYSNGQIVQDPTDNKLYISKIDSNVWGPPSTQPDYWELYTES